MAFSDNGGGITPDLSRLSIDGDERGDELDEPGGDKLTIFRGLGGSGGGALSAGGESNELGELSAKKALLIAAVEPIGEGDDGHAGVS